ncbi:hypothetical protein [Marinomonas lutimaris]|uniref:hypothetical protein n=1 Tax=Marinomonas lutimaris TaxID=2846746 RepID=UPI001CA5A5BE|nr:hypothetical protein [Marinomonas lutimaris]
MASFAASFKEVRVREKDFLAYSDAEHQAALQAAIQQMANKNVHNQTKELANQIQGFDVA